jgi:hypothetical protein
LASPIPRANVKKQHFTQPKTIVSFFVPKAALFLRLLGREARNLPFQTAEFKIITYA